LITCPGGGGNTAQGKLQERQSETLGNTLFPAIILATSNHTLKAGSKTVFPHAYQPHTCPAALRTKCTPHTTPQHTSPRHVTTRCCSHSRYTGRTHSLNHSTLATATVALPSLTVVFSCCGCRPSVWHLNTGEGRGSL
jgi:hypothetical protein